ncbi:hypothetical protein V2P22_02925 [Mycoplasma capricolum subsp. capricolum]|uniref:hypothetical protein n=1 Tax=Mycoplasma capricolum TaxID=2095 RepID=UPI003DA220C3
MDKFRYFLGSLVVTSIAIFFNSTVHKEVKGIRNYLKNRNKYISVEYSKTIDLLKELLIEIKKNNIENIDKICLSYDELVFKPIFVSRLIEDIQLDLITEEKNIISYSDVGTNVLNLLEKMYEKEKLKIKNSGKFEELSSGILMGFRYFSTLSPYYNKYCSSIKNQSNTIPIVYKYNKSIIALWIWRFVYIYFFFSFSIIGILIKFHIKTSTSNTFNNPWHDYIPIIVTISILIVFWFSSLILKKSTKMDLSFKRYLRKNEPEEYRKNKIVKKSRFFLNALNFLLSRASMLLFLMAILSLILYLGNANWIPKTYTPPFLGLVLFYSTFLCLLLNGFAALKEIYKYKKYSKKIQWWICGFEFIFPFLLCFSIFITHLCFSFFSNNINNVLWITNIILFSYWIFVITYRLFFTNKIINLLKKRHIIFQK